MAENVERGSFAIAKGDRKTSNDKMAVKREYVVQYCRLYS